MTSQSERVWTVGALLGTTAEYFSGKGIGSAKLDAEVLLAKVLQCQRIFLYTQLEREMSAPELSAYRKLVARRGSREPLAYIVGEKEFYSLRFKVGRGVLVPRPETELLVEEAVRLAQQTGIEKKNPLRILDLCTGSGCVAVALAKELPQAQIIATDISDTALGYAAENISSHNVDDRIKILHGDLFKPLEGQGSFDIIVSNPPYIPDFSGSVMQDVKKFEPAEALYSGVDGLGALREISRRLEDFLEPDGFALFEMGEGQHQQVCEMFCGIGFSCCDSISDLAGIQRIARVSRKPLAAKTSSSANIIYEPFPEQSQLIAAESAGEFGAGAESSSAEVFAGDTEPAAPQDEEKSENYQKQLEAALNAYAEGGDEEPEDFLNGEEDGNNT